MASNNSSMGGVPMLKIDGGRVKSLRESKGLTQLYLATAVEVTTDTISRWENRRYPTIKRENALKLAEALEVEVEELLDLHDGEVKEGDQGDAGNDQQGVGSIAAEPLVAKRVSWPLVWFGGGMILLAAVLWWLAPALFKARISAVRVAPDHTVPGQPFPVVVRLISDESRPSAFILKERVPPHTTVIQSRSSGAVAVDPDRGEIKWINKAKRQEVALGYILKSDGLQEDDVLELNGTVTIRRFTGRAQNVSGRNKIRLTLFHWADANMDNRIDDQEILAVYEDYSEVDGLDLDMDLIEDIWFGSSYRWEPDTRKFVIIQ